MAFLRSTSTAYLQGSSESSESLVPRRTVAIRSGWSSHASDSCPRNSGFRAMVFSPYFRPPRELVGPSPVISRCTISDWPEMRLQEQETETSRVRKHMQKILNHTMWILWLMVPHWETF